MYVNPNSTGLLEGWQLSNQGTYLFAWNAKATPQDNDARQL